MGGIGGMGGLVDGWLYSGKSVYELIMSCKTMCQSLSGATPPAKFKPIPEFSPKILSSCGTHILCRIYVSVVCECVCVCLSVGVWGVHMCR